MKLNYIFYAIIAIICWSGKVYETETCDISGLHAYGRKVSCENENDEQISCFEERMNMTAYIQCSKWYYPVGDKTSQIVHCVDSMTWSEPLLDCKPKCDNYPANIKHFGSENTKSFKWYVELVRKIPEVGKPDFYKAIILTEENVYTTDEFCSNEDLYIRTHNRLTDRFVARIYNPGGDFKDHAIRNSASVESACVVYLAFREPIRFENYHHKPVCAESLGIGHAAFVQSGKNLFETKTCNISSYDTEKFEVRCFQDVYDYSTNYNVIRVDCSKSNHNTIVKRCQLGYESQKPLTDTKNWYISRCRSGWKRAIWHSEHVENDCVLTCGEIDKEYIPPSTPLLFMGSNIETISAPWHVGIYYKEGNSIEQICGGTIIHTNIVISAAHCFYNPSLNVVNSVSAYLVAAGKKYRSFDAVETNAAFANVKEIFIPPNYSFERQQNDLAILSLDHHFNYSPHIKPVCVDWKSYTNSDIPEGAIGRVVGWGATSSKDEKSSELQTISLKTLTTMQCKNRVNPNHRNEITGDKFCAVNDNNATACRGDSGGGFVVKKKYGSTERYVLAGIVSLGVDYKKYCNDGFLSLFTNVQLYKDIIQEYISEVRNIEYFNKSTAWTKATRKSILPIAPEVYKSL